MSVLAAAVPSRAYPGAMPASAHTVLGKSSSVAGRLNALVSSTTVQAFSPPPRDWMRASVAKATDGTDSTSASARHIFLISSS